VSARYAAIQAHARQYPVRLMCAALVVRESGYYDALARHTAPPSARAVANERLRVHVRAVHRKSRGRYGAPRVHAELRAQGERLARMRVARLMHEDRLVVRRRRKRVCTTDSAHAEPVAPNLLARRFGVAEQPAPDRVWVGDLTYIPTRRVRGGCSSPCCLTSQRDAWSAGRPSPRSPPRCP
jgi:putative transposase